MVQCTRPISARRLTSCCIYPKLETLATQRAGELFQGRVGEFASRAELPGRGAVVIVPAVISVDVNVCARKGDTASELVIPDCKGAGYMHECMRARSQPASRRPVDVNASATSSSSGADTPMPAAPGQHPCNDQK